MIDLISFDLREVYPDMRGLSPRNLKYIRAFAEAWSDLEFVQRVVAQIPWRSNIALLEKLDDPAVRRWYAQKTIEHGWSQPVLCFQIETGLHIRQGKAVTNFSATLPPAESDMAVQVFKDPYLFDFLGTAVPRREREVEQTITDHIQRFLLELGAGFVFFGRQVHLKKRTDYRRGNSLGYGSIHHIVCIPCPLRRNSISVFATGLVTKP